MAHEPYQYETERFAGRNKPADPFAPPKPGRMLRWAFVWAVLICAAAAAASVIVRREMPLAAGAEPAPRILPGPKAAAPHAALGNSQVYRADPNGHFFIDARVNGAPIRFLVDTGATYVALTPDDAKAAGVSTGMLNYTLQMQTADGVTHAAPVTLREIALGQMTQEEVSAVVMQKPAALSLLGMSFLRRFNYEVRDQQLILYW